jgi:hypothetical protein
MSDLKRILELATRPESSPLGRKTPGSDSEPSPLVGALREYAARTSRQTSAAALIALASLVALPFCAHIPVAAIVLLGLTLAAGGLAFRLQGSSSRATLLIHLLASLDPAAGRTVASFAADCVP